MITLHRLGHATTVFHLNHDKIVTVEANPDTVITLSTGDKILVAETPHAVVEAVRSCRAAILRRAFSGSPSAREPRLNLAPAIDLASVEPMPFERLGQAVSER